MGLPKRSIDVSRESFLQTVAIQVDNKKPHSILKFRNSETLYVHGHKVRKCNRSLGITDDEQDITEGQFKAFIGAYKRAINKHFINNDFKVDKVELSCETYRKKNIEAWHNVAVNEIFYTVDIRSCYWQMSKIAGYITPKLYDLYINNDKYKQAKRLCVTFLAATKQMEYFTRSGEKFTIQCDNTLYEQAYRNIRYMGVNYINNIGKLIGEDYIEKNVDAITISGKHLGTVKKYMKSNGLDVKTFFCEKINEYEYKKSNKIIKFIKPLKIIKK